MTPHEAGGRVEAELAQWAELAALVALGRPIDDNPEWVQDVALVAHMVNGLLAEVERLRLAEAVCEAGVAYQSLTPGDSRWRNALDDWRKSLDAWRRAAVEEKP